MLNRTFAQLFEVVENPQQMYLDLKDTKNTYLREDYLKCIKDLLPNWSDVYITLFPTVLHKSMLDILIKEGHTESVKKLAIN